MRVLETWALSALGHVALVTGNYVEAAEHLAGCIASTPTCSTPATCGTRAI